VYERGLSLQADYFHILPLSEGVKEEKEGGRKKKEGKKGGRGREDIGEGPPTSGSLLSLYILL